jgi:hypothetical protein
MKRVTDIPEKSTLQIKNIFSELCGVSCITDVENIGRKYYPFIDEQMTLYQGVSKEITLNSEEDDFYENIIFLRSFFSRVYHSNERELIRELVGIAVSMDIVPIRERERCEQKLFKAIPWITLNFSLSKTGRRE